MSAYLCFDQKKAQWLLGKVKHLPLQDETQVQEMAYAITFKSLLNISQ